MMGTINYPSRDWTILQKKKDWYELLQYVIPGLLCIDNFFIQPELLQERTLLPCY